MNIYIPLFGMLFLTLIVWITMYIKRISWVMKNRIRPHTLSTPEKLNAQLPEEVNNASNNLKNLFELPIIFYVISLLAIINNASDSVLVISAYAFWLTRCIHSYIHCTRNIVKLRFFTYVISSLFLWFMVCYYAMQVIQ